MLTAPPAPGQLVAVRQRRFVVTGVVQSAVPGDPLGGPGMQEPQHLVELSSVEDDGLGEELRVVWELEPGVRVFERTALPDPTAGFEDPARLDAYLHAVRWGAIGSADQRALHSPFRSGIAIEDYQLDPVARALQMPRVNLLVADDVGLGKTIETGLVIQELLLRHRARTVLVVCPAAIQIHWRDQLRDKFGLEFRIVDSELFRELRRRRGLHVNPWAHFPRLITSIDFLKRERPLRLLRELLPGDGEPRYPRRFDILVVDEAHNVAPSGRGNYATDSQRTTTVRALVPHFEHKLFLSATPHNGYSESFSALLELVDDQRFHRGVKADPKQLATVMVRRLKNEITLPDGSPRFPPREIVALEVPYTDADRRAHAALTEYAASRQKLAGEEGEHFATEFVMKLLKKRLFSSPAAFATTLEKHEAAVRSPRRAATRKLAKPPAGILRRMVDGLEDAYADDAAYEEATDEAIVETTRVLRELTREEDALLRELGRYAEAAAARADAKADVLLQFLRRTLRRGKQWTDDRVIVFTEYRATQKWLLDVLAREGLAEEGRVLSLFGGMDTDERERVKAAFQASPRASDVRLLVATDAASEGIDLQNHCFRLAHYEIPWNPNRMEQRNGRVDRHGQSEKQVLIHHFVGAGWRAHSGGEGTAPGSLEGDLEFLLRAAKKVETIREDLGSVGDVIERQVEEAMLGKRRVLDTGVAARKASESRAILKIERRLREELGRLRATLEASREELELTPENVRAVVGYGLELAGQPALQETGVDRVEKDRASGEDRAARVPAFRLPHLRGSWAACAEGLAHPHTKEIRPIVFDHALAAGHDDVVLVHLNHRLVQMCLGLLRAEMWSQAGEGRAQALRRTTARVVTSGSLEDVLLDGTEARSRSGLMDAWAQIGAAHGVSLGVDGGTLWAKVGAADTEAALALIAETATRPRLTMASFDRVRAHWTQDNANGQFAVSAILYRNTHALLFGRAHPYGHVHHPVEKTNALRVEDLAALHARLLQPAHATLIMVGDVTSDAATASAARRFGAWTPRAQAPLPRATATPPAMPGARVVLVERKDEAETTVSILARGPGMSSGDLKVLEILAQSFGGLSSRMRGDASTDRGAAYLFGADVAHYRMASFLAVGAALSAPRAMPALRAMLETIADVARRGLSDTELTRARTSLLSEWRARVATTDGVSSMAANALAGAQSLDEMGRYPARLQAVTSDDVRRVAAQYLAAGALRLVVVGNLSLRPELERLGLGPVEQRKEWGDLVP